MAADNDFRAAETAAGVFDHGECFREDFIQGPGQFGVVGDGGEFGLPIGGLLTEGTSETFCNSASNSLIFATMGRSRRTSRSFFEPMNFLTM
jgi:hypothetical protein